MTQTCRYHGGLIFLGESNEALNRFGRIAAATLEDYGHLIERQTLLSTHEARIVASQYLVRLNLETDLPTAEDRRRRLDRAAGLNGVRIKRPARLRNRLVISLTPVSELLDDREISELMLVVMLYRMIDLCAVEQVEWLAPDAALSIDQFMGTFANLSPRRIRSRRQAFRSVCGPFTEADIGEDTDQPEPEGKPEVIKLGEEEILALSFRAQPEPEPVEAPDTTNEVKREERNDIQRLTSWCMTGLVMSLSAPVALSLAAVNLIRGEDFRLNTQVLSYTAAIIALHRSGAFAEAAGYLGG